VQVQILGLLLGATAGVKILLMFRLSASTALFSIQVGCWSEAVKIAGAHDYQIERIKDDEREFMGYIYISQPAVCSSVT
jgi:hypothetical protein